MNAQPTYALPVTEQKIRTRANILRFGAPLLLGGAGLYILTNKNAPLLLKAGVIAGAGTALWVINVGTK
jgi:hypothetical protein